MSRLFTPPGRDTGRPFIGLSNFLYLCRSDLALRVTHHPPKLGSHYVGYTVYYRSIFRFWLPMLYAFVLVSHWGVSPTGLPRPSARNLVTRHTFLQWHSVTTNHPLRGRVFVWQFLAPFTARFSHDFGSHGINPIGSLLRTL